MSQNLEERMEAKKIVKEAGMVSAPGYYSGRGATTSDLNDRKLEAIYQGIQRGHGVDAANQYAQMVADIPKLSATDFLLTLYTLEARDWKWNKRLLGNERGVYVDGRTDREKMAVGLATIGGALFGDNARDETYSIRREFLKRHGIETPESAGKSIFGSY